MGLRLKVFLPFALLSALLFAFLYGYWMPRSVANIEEGDLRALKLHLHSVAEGLVPLLLGHQLDAIHENLGALRRQNDDWVDIRLIDAGGKTLYPLTSTVVPPPTSMDDIRTLEQRIRLSGTDLGTLILRVDFTSRVAAIEKRHRELATALLAVLFGYLLTVAVLVEWIVRRPVNLLARAAERFAQGDFDVPLVSVGDDEVGRLVESFGRMRGAIAAYQGELLQRNQTISRLSQAVEQSPASIMITDVRGDLTFVNPKFTQLTGYGPEEVLGRNPRFLQSGLTPPAEYVRLWQTLGAGMVWHGEFCNKKKNGDLYWESASISPILDEAGTAVAFVAVKEDISGRKQAEEELRNAALKYRIVAENTYDWEFWLGPDGEFIYISPSCALITGYPVENFTDDPALFDRIVHPDDRQLMADHRGTLQRAECPGRVEYRIIRSDGRVCWLDHVCQPVFDENGAFLGVRGSNRDITERRVAEEEVRKLNAELERRVGERTAELVAKNAELERLNRLFVGRELRVIELKRRLRELEQGADGAESPERL